jgi:hypothetical protein
MYRIELRYDSIEWWAFVYTVMSLLVLDQLSNYQLFMNDLAGGMLLLLLLLLLSVAAAAAVAI